MLACESFEERAGPAAQDLARYFRPDGHAFPEPNNTKTSQTNVVVHGNERVAADSKAAQKLPEARRQKSLGKPIS